MISIIKKILVIVCCLVCIPAFCDVFSTNGHRKANGLNIELHYPSGWSHKEGIRPHIVQKFVDKNNNVCMLIIRDIGQTLSKKQWEQEIKQYSLDDYKEIFNSSSISVKPTQYEGLFGVLARYETIQERSGIKLYSTGLVHFVGYKNSMIMIQCAATDLTEQAAREKFDAVSVDFLSFGNGLVLLDKYTSVESESEEQSDINIGIIIISLLAIIFVTLITIIVLLKQNANKNTKSNIYNKKRHK